MVEIDQKAAVVGGVMWLVCLLGIWAVKFGGLTLKFKLTLTVAMLPLCYLMAYWQVNK